MKLPKKILEKNFYKKISCGGRIRTYDLQVMSLASYHYSTPRYKIIIKEKNSESNKFNVLMEKNEK